MKKGYSADSHYGDLLSDHFMALRYSQNLSLISDKIRKTRQVDILDVGGYSADLLGYMQKSGFPTKNINYYVIDYDKSALKIAESRGAKTYFFDFNFGSIPETVKEEKFDVIVCTEVLEHLLDPAKHLKSFREILKPKGVCLISLPNENTIFHRIYALIGIGIDQYPFTLYKHLHFPTVSQAKGFFGKYFKIQKIKYYINPGGKGSRFGVVGFFFRLFPDSFWYFLADRFPGLFARGTIMLGS